MNRIFGRNVKRMIGSLAAASALCAQTSLSRSQADIVVTGERLSEEEARQRATSYVRSTGVALGDRAAARWIDPICPRVLGIEAKLARFVEDRMRAVAEAAGAPLAAESCSPNALVSFVPNGADTAKRIADRQPQRFNEVSPPARAELLSGSAPVRWWYSTELRGRDGDRLSGMQPPFVKGEGGSGALPANGDTGFLSLYSNSIVSTQVVRAIRSATVLVDVNEATGFKLNAIADYAAFVALAELRPNFETQANSILGLFRSEKPSMQLTEWDARFLRELYRLPLDRRARQQRSLLAGALIVDRPVQRQGVTARK